MKSLYDVAPVSVPFSGTTDANGAFSFTNPVRKAYWTTVKVIAETTGSPNWAVRGAGGLPLDYGTGPRLSVGPFVVAPGDSLTVSGTGALPGVAVIGNIIGAQYPDMQSAAMALTLGTNPLSVNTASPPIVLGSIRTVGGGDTVAKNFPLSPGVQAVGWSVQFTGFGNPAAISITGHTTGRTYLASAGVVSGAPDDFQVAILSEADSSIDCSVTSQVQPDLVFFLGFVQNPIVFLQARPDNPTNTPFVRASATPAAWQAPTNCATVNGSNVNGGAAFTIISGVASLIIRLHWSYISDNQAVGGVSDWLLQDSAGNRLGSHSRQANFTNHELYNADRKGLPLISSNGFQAVNQQAGALALFAMQDFTQS